MKKYKVCILSNEIPDDHLLWVRACEKASEILEYHIVNLTQNSWLEQILLHDFSVLLAKPGGQSSFYKQLYDERIFILSYVLGYNVFPSANEIFIYENKRFFSFWLKAVQINHPKTDVFYCYNEALDFFKNIQFPIVAKTSIGASGRGVKILNSFSNAQTYLKETFSGKGAAQSYGPNLDKGMLNILSRIVHYTLHPKVIAKKLKIYKVRKESPQTKFVILQEYIPHEFEWRVVRIGNSFFAHKKLKKGEKASGSLLKNYDNPPLSILTYVKEITDAHNMYSQAIDIFEVGTNSYLVNEMQCIFGQSDAHQMLVNGEPGRYIYVKDSWVFEKGDFNTNESFDLRIEYVIETLKIS